MPATRRAFCFPGQDQMQKFYSLERARKAAAALSANSHADVIAVKVIDCAAGTSFYALRHEPETDKVYL
jgi:MinD-like ATPase involved in chromosome partitioning or flagellar assembly